MIDESLIHLQGDYSDEHLMKHPEDICDGIELRVLKCKQSFHYQIQYAYSNNLYELFELKVKTILKYFNQDEAQQKLSMLQTIKLIDEFKDKNELIIKLMNELING
jgi:hypothetical protein